MRFGGWGLGFGFGVQGLRYRVQGCEREGSGLGCGVQGVRVRALGSGFGVQGLGYRGQFVGTASPTS